MYLFSVFGTAVSCLVAVSGFKIESLHCEDNPTALAAHGQRCELYYDCTRRHKWLPSAIKYYDNGPKHLQPYLFSCSYPLQFDSDMKTCRNFTETKCGNRRVEQDPCRTFFSLPVPGSIHGRPCYLDSPSCVDLEDGFHPNPHMIGSPYFIMCYKGFLTYTGTCPTDENNRRMFPTKEKCQSMQ